LATAAPAWTPKEMPQVKAHAQCVPKTSTMHVLIEVNNHADRLVDFTTTDSQTGAVNQFTLQPDGQENSSAQVDIDSKKPELGDGQVTVKFSFAEGQPETDSLTVKYSGDACEVPEPSTTTPPITVVDNNCAFNPNQAKCPHPTPAPTPKPATPVKVSQPPAQPVCFGELVNGVCTSPHTGIDVYDWLRWATYAFAGALVITRPTPSRLRTYRANRDARHYGRPVN
jgi:hypothetical protein